MTDDRQRYKHFFRCRSCSKRFSVVRFTESHEGMNPKCPRKSCGGKSKQSFQADVGFDPADGKAPGVVGANVQTRAYDTAMQMTMTDHQMTDIADHSRPGSVYRAGEPTAPKLPMHLQSQADGFWAGPQRQKSRTAKVDLSPVLGSQAAPPPGVAPYRADSGSLIEPILKHRPTGSSPIPPHTIVAG